jgi:NAD(P)-dependent dehydrogenase (short-subunit alcohol dehydrogenase family)
LIAYLNEDEDARETQRLVEEAGRKAVLFAGDISAPAHCRAIIDRCVKEFGGIDVLVNNDYLQRQLRRIYARNSGADDCYLDHADRPKSPPVGLVTETDCFTPCYGCQN